MRQADRGEDLSTLVDRARTGDRGAVSAVIAGLRTRIFHYAMARIGRREEAEDVTQETCVALADALPGFDPASGRFTSFVFGIASHKVLMAQRARGRRPEVAVAEMPDDTTSDPGPYEQLERDESLRLLLAKLDGLPERHRDVLMLRVVAGLSADEVGEALGTTAANVRVIQHRALGTLRAKLTGSEISGESGTDAEGSEP
jgi:RNA polymerase sigma-70 factor (ECF subfamily)